MDTLIGKIKKTTGTKMKTFMELYQNTPSNLETVRKIYNIMHGIQKPMLSYQDLKSHPNKHGHIKLYSIVDDLDLEPIFERYVKYYGDKMYLSEIFDVDNERKYSFADDIDLTNVNDSIYQLLLQRKDGLNDCLHSLDPKITPSDRDFYQTIKEIEYYPKNKSQDEIKKSCQSLRYGDLHFDSVIHHCSSGFEPGELLPKTIKKEAIDFNTQLPYNERQFVFGPYQLLTKYEQCRNLFTARKIKNSGDRTSCHSLVEWTHFLNTLYTLCSQYTNARFIRFLLPTGSIQPNWKFSPVEEQAFSEIMEKDLASGNMELIGILTINFIDDRIGKKHPSIHQQGELGIIYLFIFKSLQRVEDKLHSHYTHIKITDIHGRQTYMDTVFGSNTVTYTEFNQLVCYLGLPTYRNINDKFMLFFDPHRHAYTLEELNEIGIEKIEYQCINVIVNANFYLIQMDEDFHDEAYTLWINPIAFDQHLAEFKETYVVNVIGNNYFLLDKKYLQLSISKIYLFFQKKTILLPINKFKEVEPNILIRKKYIVLIDEIANRDLYHGKIYCDPSMDKIYVSNRKLDRSIIDYYQLKLCAHPIQKGGASQIQLTWSKHFQEYDELIASKYFQMYNEKERYYQSLFVGEKTKPITFSFHLNQYEYVAPQFLMSRQMNQLEFVESYGGRLYLKKNALDTAFPNIYITKYVPLSLGNFYFFYEIVHRFKFLEGKTNVLEIANTPVFLEACNYYQNKYIGEIKCNDTKCNPNYQLIFMSQYTNLHEDEWKKYLTYFGQFIKLKTQIFDEYINDHFFNLTDTKYDLICSTMAYYDKSIGSILMDHLNLPINLSITIYALKNLNLHGDYIFYPTQIKIKPVADLVLICKKYFADVVLYIPEIQNKYKYSGHVVICRDYQGINLNELDDLMNMWTEISAYDPSLVNKFNVNDKSVYDKYMADLPNPKPFDPDFSGKYISSLINANKDQYQFINNFNKYVYINKALHLDKLIELKELSIEKQNEIIHQENEEKLVNARLYSEKYGFEYLSYRDKLLNQEVELNFFNQMYGYTNPIMYAFRKIDYNSDLIPIPSFYQDLKRKIYMTNFLIDTRNINEWYKVKRIVRYYSPIKKADHLTKYIENHYHTGKISQAWLKMYEMAIDFKFEGDNNTFRTFHLCEAPGNFIAALMHYMKTHTQIKDYQWKAQSLNPKLSEKQKTAFGDDYGLISKYPDRWIWGTDNTGDITKIDNIRFYGELIKDADLVTSDCGVPNELDSDSDTLLRVHFAQLVTILNGLSVGKSFLAKLMMPIVEPLQISMIYLLFTCFKQIYFYKGVVNTFSLEFYVIGKGFTGIDTEMKEKLIYYVSHFDKKIDLFANAYPKHFISQLNYILNKMVDGYIQNFDRQLYYVDNYRIITSKHMSEVKQAIHIKNIEWVSKYIENGIL